MDKVGKSGLTESDVSNYAEIMGYDGMLQELETWDESVPLTLYKTKGYKKYSRAYLKQIFKVVKDNFVLNQGGKTEEVLPYRDAIRFKGKDGKQYVGKMVQTGKGLTHETYDCSQLGVEHLVEFLEYYVEDTVKYFIKEDRKSTNKEYTDHMWVQIRLIRDLLERRCMESYLEDYLEFDESVTLSLVNLAIEMVVDKENEEEVQSGKEVYYEMMRIDHIIN